MKLLVGLGNPGKQYDNTPHNAGFLFIDTVAIFLQQQGYALSSWQELKGKSLLCEVIKEGVGTVAVLVKPITFMNLSGGAVQQVMAKYGIKEKTDLLVIYDELDLRLGEAKYSPVKNSRTHKGINSVMTTVGGGFTSLRIGVDNRENRSIPGEAYVLRHYSPPEQSLLKRAINDSIEQYVLEFIGK
jgi:PTH1 family peptidyl-tRNA hydrolase